MAALPLVATAFVLGTLAIAVALRSTIRHAQAQQPIETTVTAVATQSDNTDHEDGIPVNPKTAGPRRVGPARSAT